MKKILFLFALLACVMCGAFAFCPQPAEAASAPTQAWIEPSESNGLPTQIDSWITSSRSWWTTTYTLEFYLPGNANVSECKMSWDGGMTVSVNGVTYQSGNCPLPAAGSTATYSLINNGRTTTTFKVTTYQGSESVTPVFIEIDETGGKPTIKQMDSDPDHEVSCSGQISIDGEWYELTKIKGRGNSTWTWSSDKKPYNVTLGTKITFPGLDSAKTKKWSFLSEPFDQGLMNNRVGFELAHELGIGQDTVSADVWMNGEYQGCYTVTPKTDSFVTDDGFMIENDNYEEPPIEEGGDPQFYLKGKNASEPNGVGPLITVKEIGDDLLTNSAGEVDESAANQRAVSSQIQAWLQEAWDAILSDTGYNSKGKYYTDYIDIESFAKMYLVQEYVKSHDICGGSILFYREGMGADNKLIAGPLWDLDVALGSTKQNADLGAADDRVNGDRRSGEGDFIPNVNDFTASIYKVLLNHTDFVGEICLQYNLNREAFDAVPDTVVALAYEIADSAGMNYAKTEAIDGSNYYATDTTLGSGKYVQTYLSTKSLSTRWAYTVINLWTYCTTRTAWFGERFGIITDGLVAYVGKIFCIEDGKLVKEGWRTYGGSYCYFKDYALLKEGWVSYGSNYLYVKDYVAVKNGWVNYDGNYYYIQNYFLLKEGWVSSGGNYYYFQDYSPVVNKWISYGGRQYHFNAQGVCDNVRAA